MKRLWQRFKAWLINVLIALDQLAGAIILGSKADMTISAQAWLWHVQGRRHWLYRLIDRLFWWQKNHCYQSYLSELNRTQLPPEMRKG